MSAYNNQVYYHIQGYLETWLLATVTQKGASIRLPKTAEIIFITRLSSKFVTESSLKMPSPYLKRVTTNPVNVTLYLINRHQQPGCFCITLYTKCTCMHINNHTYTYKHTV